MEKQKAPGSDAKYLEIDAAFKALSVGNVQKLPELRPNGSHAHPHRPPQGVQSQEQATITKLEKELEKALEYMFVATDEDMELRKLELILKYWERE